MFMFRFNVYLDERRRRRRKKRLRVYWEKRGEWIKLKIGID